MPTFDRITIDPEQMNGQPCVRGMRMTVRRVVEAVATQPDRADLKREYPELEDESIRQALMYAAMNLDDGIASLEVAEEVARKLQNSEPTKPPRRSGDDKNLISVITRAQIGRLFVAAMLLLAVAFVALTLLPIGHRTAVYRAADSEIHSMDDRIILKVPRFRDPPEFRIEDGKLFLLVQDLRHALILTTIVGSNPHWDSVSLASFRAAHPELEQHWPNPDQPDAGLAWLGERH